MSLCYSLITSHTHAHAHTHTRTVPLCYSLITSHTHSLSHIHTLSHTQTNTHTHTQMIVSCEVELKLLFMNHFRAGLRGRARPSIVLDNIYIYTPQRFIRGLWWPRIIGALPKWIIWIRRFIGLYHNTPIRIRLLTNMY